MLRLPRSPISALLAAVLLVAALAGFAGCGDDATSEAGDTATTADAPTIVVTTSVLGSLVTELVGDRAEVQVLMPNGVDPHDFQPSAKDASRLQDADLIVMNGLELEESLEKPVEQAGAAGVPVFVAGDHVDVRVFGEGELPEDEHADEEHADEKQAGTEDEHAHEHGSGADDPHIWMDPAQMQKVVAALTPVVQQETGLDVAAAGKDLQGRLAALSTELAERAATVPAANRKLVTGHESMGYFARAYDFELVGAIIPSLSSQAEPSAGELAELREQIRAAKVPAIFTEIGTPTSIAEAIGDETGVRVIEVASHNLPDDGSYLTFMREVMDRVVDGLGS